jgi:hypothetical protein
MRLLIQLRQLTKVPNIPTVLGDASRDNRLRFRQRFCQRDPPVCKFVLALELEEATRLVAEPAFGISFQDGRRLSILRLRGIVSSSMPGDVTHGTELSRSSMRSWVGMAGQMTCEGIEFVIRTGLSRNEWAVSIEFPNASDALAGASTGTRDEAIATAHKRIEG